MWLLVVNYLIVPAICVVSERFYVYRWATCS